MSADNDKKQMANDGDEEETSIGASIVHILILIVIAYAMASSKLG